MSDSRYEVRRGHSMNIELISQYWDEPVELSATDVSPGGLFIPSDILLEQGEPVVACFYLDGHRQEFQLFGDIIWIAASRRATDRGPSGMGIQFIKTTPLERITIRHSLRGVPPPLPFKYQATHRN